MHVSVMMPHRQPSIHRTMKFRHFSLEAIGRELYII